MKRITATPSAVLLLFLLFTSWNTFAQLPNFTITATSTPQTCTGNGSIIFTTSGTNPSASLDYVLYLLPDITTPLQVVTSSPITNLQAGNYLLVATQSLGAESNTSSTNVTITNAAVLLEYNLATTPERCGNDGIITVNVLQGTAVGYEIISGPVTAPLQASNVFTNLTAGMYQVRVHDNCGDALVVTVQLTASTPFLSIGQSTVNDGELPACNTIVVGNTFHTVTGSQIFYPVTMQYTVFPPGGGAPTVHTYTVNNGPTGVTPNVGPVNNPIPFYHGQAYTYNLEVTDACGNVFVRTNNAVNASFDVVTVSDVINCSDNFFTFRPNFYVGPYTVNFISAPAGFVPADFNASHPVHNGNATYSITGGSVPDGTYTVEFTDACGRTTTETFEIEEPQVTAQIIPDVNGCADDGAIEIGVPGRTVAVIHMTAAPPGYPEALPHDVSAWITPTAFLMEGLPLGDYTFELIDSCGQSHTVQTTLEVTGGEPEINVVQRPGCEPGFGSIRLRDVTSALAQVTIVAAPPAYNESLPHDISFNIVAGSGILYMNTLPAGIYTINTINQCGLPASHTFTVEGYVATENTFTLTENCGSFNLEIDHASNGNYIQSFWLQAYDEDTDTWGHPVTGQVYSDGFMPTVANSVLLSTTSVNYTLQYTGIFRVIKVFHVYSNGSAGNFRCVLEVHNFEFSGRPVVESAYGFPCANGSTEVAIQASGVEPLSFSITSMNGAPFTVNNGSSNIFSGLASATYIFRVTDACGSFSNIEFNINELEPLAITAENLCEGEDGRLSVPQFSFLNYEWYEAGAPATILSTANNLELGPFDSTIHPGNYIVHIFSDNPASCIEQTLEFEVQPNNLPDAGEDDLVSLCNEGNQLDLSAYLSTGHHTGGTWTDNNGTGALTGNQLNTQGLAAGSYLFTYTVEGDCSLTDDAVITIELKNIPAAPNAASVPSICEGDSLQLTVDTVADAVYQWTGPDNFTSSEQNPLITGVTAAASGNYSVTVTVSGCSSPPSQVPVAVNAIPDFSLSGNTQICPGQTAGLSVVPENFDATSATYQWYHEGVLQPANSANIEVNQTGIYEVVVTNGNCEAMPQQIVVTENTNAFEVVLENGCRDFDYIISVVNFEELVGASYEWTGPEGILAGQTGPEVNITDMATGIYTVVVAGAEGCMETASVEILNTFCRIPKGVSPNVDELNDTFDLSNLGVQHLQIFNRYGIEVYNKENYVNEWYGQSDKGDLPSGTYYYVAALSTGRRVSGWVYLQKEN